jgi:hypothetical protein
MANVTDQQRCLLLLNILSILIFVCSTLIFVFCTLFSNSLLLFLVLSTLIFVFSTLIFLFLFSYSLLLFSYSLLLFSYCLFLIAASVAEWLNIRLIPRCAASVRILLEPIWMCEKVCQFTCGRSVFSPQIHCIIKTDRHHITENLLGMAKNAKQTNKETNKQYIPNFVFSALLFVFSIVIFVFCTPNFVFLIEV